MDLFELYLLIDEDSKRRTEGLTMTSDDEHSGVIYGSLLKASRINLCHGKEFQRQELKEIASLNT